MIEVMVPRETVNDESVRISKIYFEDGAPVQEGEVVVEVETSKTNIEVVSPKSGYVRHSMKVGADFKIATILFKIDFEKKDSRSGENSGVVGEIESPSAVIMQKLSKKAEERLLKMGSSFTDLPQFAWVTSKDFEPEVNSSYAIQNELLEKFSDVALSSEGISAELNVFSKRKLAEIKALSNGARKALPSLISIDLTISNERLVDPPYIFRNSISDLVIFESAKLLRGYPDLNSSYVSDQHFKRHPDVHFGVSFDNGSNLKVLTLKHADEKQLQEIQTSFMELLELYDSGGAIEADLLGGSTITVSDLSNTAASFMHPLLNGDQAMIIGIVRSTNSSYRLISGFDHRLSEGLAVSKFLEELAVRIKSHFKETAYFEASCYRCEKSLKDEIGEGSPGLLKIIKSNGDEVCVCRSCFNGW